MIRKLLTGGVLLSLLVLATAFAACGDDDDATPSPSPSPDPAALREVEDVATKLLEVDTTSTADVQYFVDHVTAKGLTYFGYSTADECKANADDCIGDASKVSSTSGTTITGDAASTLADTDNGVVKVVLQRESNTWKLNGYAFANPVPDGVTNIEVKAIEYGYDWDKTKAPAAGAPVAFSLKNDGQEAHEMLLATVEDDFDVQTAIDSLDSLGPDEFPAGVSDIVNFTAATPGETGTQVFADGLEAGKYAFICFFPSPDGTPHLALGMASDFTVK